MLPKSKKMRLQKLYILNIFFFSVRHMDGCNLCLKWRMLVLLSSRGIIWRLKFFNNWASPGRPLSRGSNLGRKTFLPSHCQYVIDLIYYSSFILKLNSAKSSCHWDVARIWRESLIQRANQLARWPFVPLFRPRVQFCCWTL